MGSKQASWIHIALMTLIAFGAVGGVLVIDTRDANAQGRDAPTSPLRAALASGDYEKARQYALRHDDTESLLARAMLAEMEGSLSNASRFARVALDAATRDQDKIDATVAVAKYEIAAGKWQEAEERLRETLKAYPNAHTVRLELGLIMQQQGKLTQAAPILEHFTQLYNNGNLTTSASLVLLGRAMHAVGGFDDANYAYQQAYNKNNKNIDALVHWGELFLEKYNLADANRNFEEALQINPNHPRALIGRAAIEMASSNRSDNVIPLLEKVESIAPAHPELWTLRAHMAIRDSDCGEARKSASKILEKRPKYVDALTVYAICDYLADDKDAFAESSAKVMALNPKNATFWARVADYGVMVHRYVEAMDLYRKALSIDPKNPPALVGLGIGLSRINREDEAIEFLGKAFDIDPYNVRAYNMVELYEKTMPSYSFKEYTGYKVRAHKREFGLVNLFVAPVVDHALEVFSAKYKYEPEPGLAVEIYPDPTTFSVRSVGLPHISPHGICFGRVVTVRSPSDGNFNWRQVVWHELAHVYHLQISKSRVPRWFTEGLAEYETNVWDAAWQRHHDRELAIKVFRGEIPSVLELDFGFTHARSHVEILRAYHLASLAVHFTAETWGFEKIVAMLEGWAVHNDTEKVISKVLGVSVAEYDKRFATWLERRLMNFDSQFTFDTDSIGSVKDLERAIKLNELDAKSHAKLAVARILSNDSDGANKSLEDALAITSKDPTVNYAAMIVRAYQQNAKEVIEHGDLILDAGRDGYGLRLLLASASLQMGDPETARVHLVSATQLYEGGVTAWYELGELAKNIGDKALAEEALRELYMLDQHDPNLAKARFQLARAEGDEDAAWGALMRWVDVHPFSVELHEYIVEMAPSRGAKMELARSWRAMTLLQPKEREAHYKAALEDFDELGMSEEIARFKQLADEEGVKLE